MSPMTPQMFHQQYGALPWRGCSHLEYLLISSRQSRRWVIPKGWPIKKLAPHEAARREAFEEAGIGGEIASEPFGRYFYLKRNSDWSVMPCRVDVFPMHVSNQLASWPERHERETRWFTPADAAAAVAEPDLAALIRGFADQWVTVSAGHMQG